MQTGKTSGAER